MFTAYKLIYIIVLVQSECSQASRKNTSADTTCYHPSRKNFGLVMNGSVRESLMILPKTIAGFLLINDSGQEDITLNINNCNRSQDCRIYIVLDKKKENAMTICLVANERKNCFLSTCTCLSNLTRRAVQSPLFTPIPKTGPQEATCKFESILRENITDNIPENITNLKDERPTNPMECTTPKFKTKKITLPNTSEENKLPDIGIN